MHKAIPLAAALAILGLWPSAALAGGSLDTTFGGDGLVTTSFGPGTDDEALDLAIDGNDRIVAAGESGPGIAVARYLPDGSLDPSFGSGDGLVTMNFGRLEDFFHGVAIDGSGRIVIAATTSSDTSCTDCDFALARFTDAGVLDPAFGGGDGKVVTDLGSGDCDYASDLAIDGSGRIVVAGTACKENPPDYSDFAVARYTEAGNLDTSFDADGIVTTDMGSGHTDGARVVALDGSGRIVVAGESGTGNGFAFSMTRYLGTGALDSSFSGDGKVISDVAPGQNAWTSDLDIDASGRIVMTGRTFPIEPGVPEASYIFRYVDSGSLDPSFSGDGIVMISPPAESGIDALAIDGSERLVVAGSWVEHVYSDVAVLRFLSDGSPDSSFGVGGLVQADFGAGSEDYANSVGLDSVGRIVIAGTTGPFGTRDFAAARFLPEGAFVPPPSQPPIEPPIEPPATPPTLPTASPLPISNATVESSAPSTHAKRRKCKRGFKKRKVRGKARCVKVKRTPRRRLVKG